MESIRLINYILAIFFFVCYAYQFAYVGVSLIGKKRRYVAPSAKINKNRYAVLIAARNEENVIAQLISSINEQTYGREYISIFVVADNCTDNTAEISREAGAVVYERSNTKLTGKGYALDYLLKRLEQEHEPFDGYFVFDADNVLERDYIRQMDITFNEGNDIVTGYRNSKNYGDNWISAGYALWFLRESQYLNKPRYISGTSCAVSGTGFLFSNRILRKYGGWPFHLLTEDIEFSVSNIIDGEKIAYCEKAALYDEQPSSFAQSWRQRLRWSRGYLQVFRHYGLKLIKGVAGKNGFSCFDMTMSIMPAAVVSVLSMLINLTALICGIVTQDGALCAAICMSVAQSLLNCYITLFAIGGLTVITERKNIRASLVKKILYTFTFPLFMFTYIPITVASFFGKVTWKPIYHSKSVSLDDIKS